MFIVQFPIYNFRHLYLLTHIMEVISFQTLSYFLRSVKDQQRGEIKWSVAYYLQNWYVLVAYGLFAVWGLSTMVVTASSGMQKSDEREEEGMKGILEKRGRKSARVRSLPSADLPSADLFSALLTLLNHFFLIHS